MSSVLGVFDFAPSSRLAFFSDKVPFRISNETSDGCSCSLRFPLCDYADKAWDKTFFDRVWDDSRFSLDHFEQDFSGNQMTDCVFNKISWTISVLEYMEMAVEIYGHKSEAKPILGDQVKSISNNVYTAFNCVPRITNEHGDFISGDYLTSITVEANRAEPDVFRGKIKGFNQGLGTHVGHHILSHIKRSAGHGKISVGYKSGTNSPDVTWLANIKDVSYVLAGRSVKDGLDVVEIDFVGKRDEQQ